jgi:phage FluMu protein Com
VLENLLYIDIEKSCSKCKESLREEEIFSGFQKNLSNYLVKCPICKAMFVPKFSIYSEQDSNFLNGRKG